MDNTFELGEELRISVFPAGCIVTAPHGPIFLDREKTLELVTFLLETTSPARDRNPNGDMVSLIVELVWAHRIVRRIAVYALRGLMDHAANEKLAGWVMGGEEETDE